MKNEELYFTFDDLKIFKFISIQIDQSSKNIPFEILL